MEKKQRKDRLVWTVFVSLVGVFGFFLVTIFSQSTIIDRNIPDTSSYTASVHNTEVQEVEVTMIPVEEQVEQEDLQIPDESN